MQNTNTNTPDIAIARLEIIAEKSQKPGWIPKTYVKDWVKKDMCRSYLKIYLNRESKRVERHIECDFGYIDRVSGKYFPGMYDVMEDRSCYDKPIEITDNMVDAEIWHMRRKLDEMADKAAKLSEAEVRGPRTSDDIINEIAVVVEARRRIMTDEHLAESKLAVEFFRSVAIPILRKLPPEYITDTYGKMDFSKVTSLDPNTITPDMDFGTRNLINDIWFMVEFETTCEYANGPVVDQMQGEWERYLASWEAKNKESEDEKDDKRETI